MAWQAEHAHSQQIRDIDFNSNKPYTFATASDDCTVKFWDYKKLSEPILELSTHSHWLLSHFLPFVMFIEYNFRFSQGVESKIQFAF